MLGVCVRQRDTRTSQNNGLRKDLTRAREQGVNELLTLVGGPLQMVSLSTRPWFWTEPKTESPKS